MTISISYEGMNASPAVVRITTTANLTTVTSQNWLQSSMQQGALRVSNADLVEVAYSQGTSSAATHIFSVAITNSGNITLSLAESSVITPTIANHIATYNDTSGTLTEDPATAISGGNIQAGLSGTAGWFVSFPATAASGNFQFKAANSAGNFNAIFTHASLGQSSTWTMADPGAATSKILQAAGTLVTGNLLKASGTAGLMVDQGVAMKTVAQAAVAGGAAAQTVTDAFCTSASNVICTWNDTTNAVSIQKAVAGNGSFVVTSSGDPGASHLNYVIFK